MTVCSFVSGFQALPRVADLIEGGLGRLPDISELRVCALRRLEQEISDADYRMAMVEEKRLRKVSDPGFIRSLADRCEYLVAQHRTALSNLVFLDELESGRCSTPMLHRFGLETFRSQYKRLIDYSFEIDKLCRRADDELLVGRLRLGELILMLAELDLYLIREDGAVREKVDCFNGFWEKERLRRIGARIARLQELMPILVRRGVDRNRPALVARYREIGFLLADAKSRLCLGNPGDPDQVWESILRHFEPKNGDGEELVQRLEDLVELVKKYVLAEEAL